jgi:hypothetical protein
MLFKDGWLLAGSKIGITQFHKILLFFARANPERFVIVNPDNNLVPKKVKITLVKSTG